MTGDTAMYRNTPLSAQPKESLDVDVCEPT